MPRRLLAISVILTVATGCDNVEWGGIDVQLKDPPPRAESVVDRPSLAESAEEERLPDLPEGPILLAGQRDGALATLVVVGEVTPDGTLVGFPDESSVPGFRQHFTNTLLTPGSDWILFAQGVRVGRLTAVEIGLDESFCVPRPTITGTVELVPGAMNARRVLALPAGRAARRAYLPYETHTHDYAQRVGSLAMAQQAMSGAGATWPADLVASRADIQVIRLNGTATASVAATFVHRDRLTVESPGAGAYSIFLMGGPREGAYRTDFSWYRPADEEGKGAPRYFEHLDLNDDGSDEILLDVFGAENRWFAALNYRGGTWVRSYQDACGDSRRTGG